MARIRSNPSTTPAFVRRKISIRKVLMPCQYVIHVQNRLVLTTARGRVTFAETKAHQDALKKDPDFNPHYNQLIDATAVTEFDLSMEEVRTMASGSDFFSSASRRAWLASDPPIFGMGRVMEAYCEMASAKAQLGVFSDRDAALKWLNPPISAVDVA